MQEGKKSKGLGGEGFLEAEDFFLSSLNQNIHRGTL